MRKDEAKIRNRQSKILNRPGWPELRQKSHWQKAAGLLQPPSAFHWGGEQFNRNRIMSQHRSLRAASTLGGKRNVMKRFERIEVLKKRGQWKDGDRITGLRKTKPEV
jgi:small basic protein (TIGR04137 family)